MGGFQLVHDRGVAQELGCVSWCGKMDLVAMVLGGVDTQVQRLSWQRVGSFERAVDELSALEWSPDGRLLATGDHKGEIRIFRVETGEMMPAVAKLEAGITFMHWIELDHPNTESDWDYKDDCETSTLKLAQELFNILLIGDSTGKIHVRAYGAQFNLFEVQAFDGVPVTCVSYNQKMGQIGAVSGPSRSCCIVDVRIIGELHRELERLGGEAVMIRGLLSSAREAVKKSFRWEENARSLREKIEPLEKILRDHDEDKTIEEALKSVAAGGQMSPAMQYLFGKELMEGTIRRKLRLLKTAYEETREIIQKELLEGAENLLYRCSCLAGLADLNGSFGRILVPDDVNKMVHYATELLTAAHRTMAVLSESWKRYDEFSTFIIWKCIQQLDGETPGELDVDIDGVFKFLELEWGHRDRFEQYLHNEMDPLLGFLVNATNKVLHNTSQVISRDLSVVKRQEIGDDKNSTFQSAVCRSDGVFEVISINPESKTVFFHRPDLLDKPVERSFGDSSFIVNSVRHYTEDRIVLMGYHVRPEDESVQTALAVCEDINDDVPWSKGIAVKSGLSLDLHVGVGRGLASLTIGKRRIVTYDLEDLEEDEE